MMMIRQKQQYKLQDMSQNTDKNDKNVTTDNNSNIIWGTTATWL